MSYSLVITTCADRAAHRMERRLLAEYRVRYVRRVLRSMFLDLGLRPGY